MNRARLRLTIARWMIASCAACGFWSQQAGAAPLPVAAQQEQVRIRRLILKDGSYEPIIQYEIKGDRVRFLSADRHEWEEVPSSLIDWPATEKYAGEAVAARAAASAKAGGENSAALPAAAGIVLPPDGGVFLLDVYQGNPELIGLRQNGADVNKNTARNILRAAVNPVAGPRQTIELKGAHAPTQAHALIPSVFISLEPDTDAAPKEPSEDSADRYHIVRCEERGGNRVVGVIDIAIYGKVKQRADVVDAKVEPFAGRWVKVTPAVALKPGEYALVEMLGKQGMNQFVWDFGIDPGAPANPGAMKPEPPRQPPVLLKKTKKP
jgi:hypothetical protein